MRRQRRTCARFARTRLGDEARQEVIVRAIRRKGRKATEEIL
jgi:hypothetical protein